MDKSNTPAVLPAQLMLKPALSFEELFTDLLNLPESTAEQVAREEPKPKLFLIGRRRYILTPDAVEYLNELARAKPYHPRRNKRG